jgi:hypothetical protein
MKTFNDMAKILGYVSDPRYHPLLNQLADASVRGSNLIFDEKTLVGLHETENEERAA